MARPTSCGSTQAGGLPVRHMNGAAMVGSEFLNSGWLAAPGWQVVGAADFNGDGKADLMWQHIDGWLGCVVYERSTSVSRLNS